jgi:prefoldin subunit 5
MAPPRARMRLCARGRGSSPSLRLTDLAVLPLSQMSRLIAVGEALVALGTRAETTLASLDETGRQNAELGEAMLVVARQSVEVNREANAAITALTERSDRLLAHAESLEAELPALRDGLTALDELRRTAGPLGDAAPAMQAAAERVDRVASRIPGMRD